MFKKYRQFTVLIILFVFSFFSCAFNKELFDDILKKGVDSDVLEDDDDYVHETVSLPQPHKKWTIMVYMAADNNLDEYSVGDVEEMLDAGGSSSNFNLVILWDQSNTGYGNRHGYYYIGNREAILVKDTGEINMGDPETAKAFIDYTLVNFTADNYMFIFWDHGSGVDKSFKTMTVDITKAVCQDDSSGGDTLSDSDQFDIISYFDSKIPGKVDIVGYDACLMGMTELMYQIKDYSDYFIGSEDIIPGDGYNYNFIIEIDNNPDITPAELGSEVVDYYYSYYSGYPYITLSCIDQSKIETLKNNINSFANKARLGPDSNTLFRTSNYNISSPYPIQCYPSNDLYNPPPNGYEFFDLYSYMNAINNNGSITNADVKTYANNILTLINSGGIIINEKHGSDHNSRSYGISIYIDVNGIVGASYNTNAFSNDTDWNEFLDWLY